MPHHAIEAGDPRPLLAERPMSVAQKLGVANTLLLTATDGFDILATSFAAPGLTQDWSLKHETLGYILAMNLIGMGLGAMLIAPLADRIGRRRLSLIALLLIALSMGASALANSPLQLGALRLVTGLCIGGMVGSCLALAMEYANRRNRTLTASIMSVGMPIGGALGALAASFILINHDWRMIFVMGGVATALVALISFFFLTESVDFLIGRNDPQSRARLDRTLRKYGLPPLPEGFTVRQAEAQKTSYAGLFSREGRATTLAMMAINFAMMSTVYFCLGWLPQIIAEMGFAQSDAVGSSAYLNMGGVVGALTLGWAARNVPPARLTIAAMVGAAITVIALALLPQNLLWLRIGAALHGFMAMGATAGIYGILGSAFSAPMRATGIGLSFGCGRLGTITATIIPGLLLSSGWSNFAIASCMSLGALVAAVTLWRWGAAAARQTIHI